MPAAMEPALGEMRTDSRPDAHSASGIASLPPSFRVKSDPVSAPSSRFADRKVHFIGIGGSGMSGLARMLLDCGAVVSGSEPSPNPQTFDLTKHGARVSRD